jgi:two-component system probable response regulator PhcQ
MGVKDVLGEVIASIQQLGDGTLYSRAREAESQLLMASEELGCQRALAQGSFDYDRFAVLYVDDEQKSLKCFARQYGRTFRIITASNAADALKILKQSGDEIGIVMSDLRMPGRNGRWLLDRVRQSHPLPVRILVSTFPSSSELESAVEAANTGDIYTYVPTPWDPSLMEHLLRRAMEYFALGREQLRIATVLS